MNKEFNISDEWKSIGIVIDNFNQLELIINKIIVLYVKPVKNKLDFFLNQLLNNSIIRLIIYLLGFYFLLLALHSKG